MKLLRESENCTRNSVSIKLKGVGTVTSSEKTNFILQYSLYIIPN